MVTKEEPSSLLRIKKASFFLFGLSLLFLPGQNPYLLATSSRPSIQVQDLGFELPLPAAYPVNFTGEQPPALTAQSVLVMDQDSAVVLFEKNAQTKLLPASTVKMMTALVALDHYHPDQVLTVNGASWEGQDMKLQEGEEISVRALLYGLLVASANDAAQVLAQNYPGGEEEFVVAMNQKAQDLNLTASYFANPTGLDTDANDNLLPHHSLSTTLDLARLAIQALRQPLFARVVATREIAVSDVTGKILHRLGNINELLGRVEGLRGVKTGWTHQAGECLVSFVERNGKGIVIVVLGSQDRFGETAQLVEWAFVNHSWEVFTPPT